MVQSLGDFIYKEIKRGLISCFLEEKRSIKMNIRKLNQILMLMNITKSSLAELEMEDFNSLLRLLYLLQTNHNINFGICKNYKIWKNRNGWQYGCFLDKGKRKRIQVYCGGDIKKCERKIRGK